MFGSQVAPESLESIPVPVLVQFDNARKNARAFWFGLGLGLIPPAVSFILTHWAINWDAPLERQVLAFAALGFLAFSATTVCHWFTEAWNSRFKAVAVTLGLEVTMVFLPDFLFPVSCALAGVLVVINAVATASLLAKAESNYHAKVTAFHEAQRLAAEAIQARAESERKAAQKAARASRKAAPVATPAPESGAAPRASQGRSRSRKARTVEPLPESGLLTPGGAAPATA